MFSKPSRDKDTMVVQLTEPGIVTLDCVLQHIEETTVLGVLGRLEGK